MFRSFVGCVVYCCSDDFILLFIYGVYVVVVVILLYFIVVSIIRYCLSWSCFRSTGVVVPTCACLERGMFVPFQCSFSLFPFVLVVLVAFAVFGISLCRNFLNSVMFSVFVKFNCKCCVRIFVVDRPRRVNFGSMVYSFPVNGGQSPGRVCSACLFLA